MMLESQHKGILLAQQERAATAEHMTHTEEASAARIARLEDAILLLLAQSAEPTCNTPPTPPSRINLQKFRIADGPLSCR
jgi:hypothetical protein